MGTVGTNPRHIGPIHENRMGPPHVPRLASSPIRRRPAPRSVERARRLRELERIGAAIMPPPTDPRYRPPPVTVRRLRALGPATASTSTSPRPSTSSGARSSTSSAPRLSSGDVTMASASSVRDPGADTISTLPEWSSTDDVRTLDLYDSDTSRNVSAVSAATSRNVSVSIGEDEQRAAREAAAANDVQGILREIDDVLNERAPFSSDSDVDARAPRGRPRRRRRPVRLSTFSSESSFDAETDAARRNDRMNEP